MVDEGTTLSASSNTRSFLEEEDNSLCNRSISLDFACKSASTSLRFSNSSLKFVSVASTFDFITFIIWRSAWFCSFNAFVLVSNSFCNFSRTRSDSMEMAISFSFSMRFASARELSASLVVFTPLSVEGGILLSWIFSTVNSLIFKAAASKSFCISS